MQRPVGASSGSETRSTTSTATLCPKGVGGVYGRSDYVSLRYAREPEFNHGLIEGLAPYRQPEGCYRLRIGYHYLIARA
jgi:hypothetical protein